YFVSGLLSQLPGLDKKNGLRPEGGHPCGKHVGAMFQVEPRQRAVKHDRSAPDSCLLERTYQGERYELLATFTGLTPVAVRVQQAYLIVRRYLQSSVALRIADQANEHVASIEFNSLTGTLTVPLDCAAQ